jgi:hypothetical protein
MLPPYPLWLLFITSVTMLIIWLYCITTMDWL